MNWTESVEAFLEGWEAAASTKEKYRRALAEFTTWYYQEYGQAPEAALLNDVELQDWKVHLNSTVRQALREYLKARPAWSAQMEDDQGRSLFISKRGHRLDRRDVGRMIESAAWAAAIKKKVTPHTLRHTFASRFLQQGGNLAVLRDILGHKNIATTSRYVHSTAEQLLKSVENL